MLKHDYEITRIAYVRAVKAICYRCDRAAMDEMHEAWGWNGKHHSCPASSIRELIRELDEVQDGKPVSV